MSEKTKASDAQVAEMLAFQLACIIEEHVEERPRTPSELGQAWRDDPKMREAFRKLGAALSGRLHGCGIAVRSSNSKKVIDAVEDLRTQPSRPAYSLDAPATPSGSPFTAR